MSKTRASKRDPEWSKWEQYVEEQLQEVDPKTRLTKNTGATHQDGDVLMSEFSVQCKYKSTSGLSLTQDELTAYETQARSVGRQGILVVRCDTDDYAVLKFDLLKRLLQEIYEVTDE